MGLCMLRYTLFVMSNIQDLSALVQQLAATRAQLETQTSDMQKLNTAIGLLTQSHTGVPDVSSPFPYLSATYVNIKMSSSTPLDMRAQNRSVFIRFPSLTDVVSTGRHSIPHSYS